ncbi:MAG: hypothetical protein H7145_03790 [Akkermansiaceae bacterium]|nr:hypothetical protein [Armatimonadota bacterium]
MVFKQKGAAMIAATLGLCAAFGSDARADLKLEQTVTVSGVPKMDNGKITTAAPTTEKTVTYYKNGKQRTETADVVIIHDTATEKTLFLNPKKKTFYEASSAEPTKTDDSDPMAEMMKMAELNGDVAVTDLKEEKNILGKKAHHYSYVMTLKLSMKDPKAPAMMAGFLPTFTMSGDQWMAEMPDSQAFAKRIALPAFADLPSGFGKGLKTITEKMGTMKGFPLEATASSKTSLGSTVGAGYNDKMGKEPIVRKTITTLLSEEPLPEALFAPPSDYKKVKAPGTKE